MTEVNQRATMFVGGATGNWKIKVNQPIIGEGLPSVARLSILSPEQQSTGIWTLRGVSSYVRYVERDEMTKLQVVQDPLGRPDSTCGALIPIQKSQEWWDLTQEERRNIFETQSHHIANSMKYLPAIARQLYHSRDLGEPFDFLTWFEYAPKDAGRFEELVGHLRSTEEWKYVIREIDLRLVRD